MNSGGNDPLLISDDRIVLHEDGTYLHSGTTIAGQSFTSNGLWSYDSRGVSLQQWRDYAGITSRLPRGSGVAVNMNVVVEFSRPPLIVIDPDRNIFYERVKGR